jgi:iron complex outermembrane receptor protein
LLCLFVHHANGQDTLNLNVVEITAPKVRLSQVGKKTETLDSNLRSLFRFSSVADAISLNSPVFIKSYGPGGIATTAFRGGNAAQTALLWNGFNLQNTLLGQADLALLPSVLFEEVEIEYGGSSSLWGSGAVGGSIHLNNKLQTNRGLFARINLGGGSTGFINTSAQVTISGRRFVSSTKIYATDASNNFAYRDPEDVSGSVKRQNYANYLFKGLMQEMKWVLNGRNEIRLNGWLNAADRHLPAFNRNYDSRQYQQDQALRFTALWRRTCRNLQSVTKAAYFNDMINYTDSLSMLFSKNKVHVLIAENENYFQWHRQHQLNFGINYTGSIGVSSNYNGTQTLSRTSLLIGERSSFFKDRLLVYLAGRADYFSAGNLPLTGSFSTEYRAGKLITLKSSVARVYRQPTLNDLYWFPGGNPALKAEQGMAYEASAVYRRKKNSVDLLFSTAAYTRKIANWISWIPGANGTPSPVNIQEVWSRGTETTFRIEYNKNKWHAGGTVKTGYVLSTPTANEQESSNLLYKQLVYTPRYSANANFQFGYAGVSLTYFHQYTGYRFTASDNTEWLPPYNYSSLKLSCRQRLYQADLILFASVNNLYNASYAVIKGWPTPLRNYELGITIQTNKKNKT